MTAINYSDLCAYVACRAADTARFATDILRGQGIPTDVATAEDIAQAHVEATDIVVEDYYRDFLVDGDPWKFYPPICAGQPKEAPCWKMRGYN